MIRSLLFKIRMKNNRFRSWNNLEHYPKVLVNPIPDTLREAILRIIGGASMSWDKPPRGVFDSDNAIRLADELIDWIRKNNI